MTAPTTEAPAETAPAPDQPETAPMPEGAIPFTMPLFFLEGFLTSDNRLFGVGGGTLRPLPWPFQATDESAHGGVPAGAVNAGLVTTVERYDASAVVNELTGQPFGEGTFAWRAAGWYAPDGDGPKYARLAAEKRITGVSIDAGANVEEIEVISEDAEGFATEMVASYPEWELMGITQVPFPAFAQARIVVDPADLPGADPAAAIEEAVAAAAQPQGDPTPWVRVTLTEPCSTCPDGTLVAAGTVQEDAPPAEWFRDPELSGPTPLTVTADGRVYGHLAAWESCHTGMPGRCVTAPRSPDGTYSHFTVGAVLCADGTLQAVGSLTVAANHADLSASASAAVDHYANTGQSAALVAAGEDAHGIWVAGYVPPETPGPVVAALRGHPLSGDWRPVGGQLRLVGALAVNTPGFLVPRARVASGRPVALVAAGSAAVTAAARPTEEPAPPSWASALQEELAAMRRDREATRALTRITRRR